jgi:hypothetical protein
MAVLSDYENYLKALRGEATGTIPNTSYNTKRNTTPTGFKEFSPRDEVAQAKYDALSPTWEGIESSEAAIARGDYDLDRAEKNRAELRKNVPQLNFQKSGGLPPPPPPKKEESSSCVVS